MSILIGCDQMIVCWLVNLDFLIWKAKVVFTHFYLPSPHLSNEQILKWYWFTNFFVIQYHFRICLIDQSVESSLEMVSDWSNGYFLKWYWSTKKSLTTNPYNLFAFSKAHSCTLCLFAKVSYQFQSEWREWLL